MEHSRGHRVLYSLISNTSYPSYHAWGYTVHKIICYKTILKKHEILPKLSLSQFLFFSWSPRLSGNILILVSKIVSKVLNILPFLFREIFIFPEILNFGLEYLKLWADERKRSNGRTRVMQQPKADWLTGSDVCRLGLAHRPIPNSDKKMEFVQTYSWPKIPNLGIKEGLFC